MCNTNDGNRAWYVFFVYSDGVCLHADFAKQFEAGGIYLLYTSGARCEALIFLVVFDGEWSTETKLVGLIAGVSRTSQ